MRQGTSPLCPPLPHRLTAHLPSACRGALGTWLPLPSVPGVPYPPGSPRVASCWWKVHVTWLPARSRPAICPHRTPAGPPSSLLLCQQDRGWPVAASASSGPRPVRAGHLAWGWGWPEAPPTRSSCFSLTCSAKPPAPSHSAVSAVARSLPGVRVQNSQGLSTP